MTATKSGNNIHVDGTGNTLSSITSDIADTAYIYSGSGNLYTVDGSLIRYLQIRNGGELIIGDPNDFSFQETLALKQNTNFRNRLYVEAGGSLKMYGRSQIDLSQYGAYFSYAFCYGSMYITGSDVHKPMIFNGSHWFNSEIENNNTYTDDIWTMNNVVIGSCSNFTQASWFNIDDIAKVRNHSFTNITFDHTQGTGSRSQIATEGPYVGNSRNMGNITMENWDTKPLRSGPFYSGCPTAEFKSFQLGESIDINPLDFKMVVDGSPSTTKDLHIYSKTYDSGSQFGQNFLFLNSCSFAESSETNYDLKLINAAQVLLKDCQFVGTDGVRINVRSNSIAMIWTGNTYGLEEHSFNNGGIKYVKDLTLTVQDEQSNPIEGALVEINQSDGYESFIFETKDNGKLWNCLNFECAFLTNTYRFSTSNTQTWSDESEGNYHMVTVSKMGYKSVQQSYYMSGTRSDTIILKRSEARALTF